MVRPAVRLAMFASLLSSAALAQGAQPQASPLDELVPAEGAPVSAPPQRTGDAVIDRLNALEVEVRDLRSKNHALEEKIGATEIRVESAEVRAAKDVQWASGPSPTLGDVLGDTTFKLRGIVDIDGAAYFGGRGGYDYSDGTQLRRARIGIDGVAFHDFPYRLEVDFFGDVANVLDAYVSYTGIKRLTFTAGQFKAPYGLEPNTSDSFNTFIERGMFNVAYGNIGAERRIGGSVAYVTDKVTATVAVLGDNESVGRNPAAPGESYGVNGRFTWEPVQDTGRLIHLGAAGYYREHVQTAGVRDSTRVTERPNARVDGGLIIDSGAIGGVERAVYYGAEGAAVYGPFSVQAEGGELELQRLGSLPTFRSNGFYAFGSWFLTGESRPFKNGVADRLRPYRNLDPKAGGFGAVELAFRYDALQVYDTPIVGRTGNEAETFTTAINWYFNPNMKLLINWIRFDGRNSPLDPIGHHVLGDVLTARVHVDW